MLGCRSLSPDRILKCKGFVISHLNVRSLLRHIDEVFYYLGHSDLICLSETWLTHKVNDSLLAHTGYDYIRHDRLGKKKGGACWSILRVICHLLWKLYQT